MDTLVNKIVGHKKIVLPTIVMLLILGLGFQIYRNISQRNQPRTFPETWETYELEQHNFSFNFPSAWLINEFPLGNHGDKEMILSISEGIRCLGCVRLGEIGPTIYISRKLFNNPTSEMVFLWGLERIEAQALDGVFEADDPELAKSEEFDIFFRTYRQKDSISNNLEPSIDAYIMRNNDALIFSLSVEPKDYDELLPIFKQVVLSFQPTN